MGPARNYSLRAVKDALLKARLPATVVDGICHRYKGNKWEIWLNNPENCVQFITATRSLVMKTSVGLVECPVSAYHDDLKCIRVMGLGLAMPARDVLRDFFKQYGEFKMAMPEKHGALYHVYNGRYI